MKNKIILTTKELSVLFDSVFGFPNWVVRTVNIFSPPQLWFSNNKRVVRKTEFLGVTKKFWPCQIFDPPPPEPPGRPPPGCCLPGAPGPGGLNLQLSHPTPSGRRLRRSAPPSRPRPLRLRYGSPQDAGTGVWVGGPGSLGGGVGVSRGPWTRYPRPATSVCVSASRYPLPLWR